MNVQNIWRYYCELLILAWRDLGKTLVPRLLFSIIVAAFTLLLSWSPKDGWPRASLQVRAYLCAAVVFCLWSLLRAPVALDEKRKKAIDALNRDIEALNVPPLLKDQIRNLRPKFEALTDDERRILNDLLYGTRKLWRRALAQDGKHLTRLRDLNLLAFLTEGGAEYVQVDPKISEALHHLISQNPTSGPN